MWIAFNFAQNVANFPASIGHFWSDNVLKHVNGTKSSRNDPVFIYNRQLKYQLTSKIKHKFCFLVEVTIPYYTRIIFTTDSIGLCSFRNRSTNSQTNVIEST